MTRRRVILDATEHSCVAVCGDECPTAWRTAGPTPAKALCALAEHVVTTPGHNQLVLKAIRHRCHTHHVSLPDWIEHTIRTRITNHSTDRSLA